MATSALPPARYIPGRQEAIDNAGRINKLSFVVSASVLFGTAVLSIVARFAIRIIGHRKIKWDDGLVLLATIELIAAFGLLLKVLNSLYLVEAMNQKVAYPFREDLHSLLRLTTWAYSFSALNWTAVYTVKLTFMYFFHVLILGLSQRITRLYWTTLCIQVISWIYTVVNPFIICGHFGASASQCSANPHQHARSVAGNVTIAILDIAADIMIVAIPLIVVNKSMMPFAQKVSIVTLLGLSVVMIICAIIRIVGSLVDTRPDGSGTAPVWSTYWAFVEGCISVTMTSVIAIRGVFISHLIRDDRDMHDGLVHRFYHRLLSTLRITGSARSSRRSPQRSGENSGGQQAIEPGMPKITSQDLPGSTLNGVRTLFGLGSRRDRAQHDTTVQSIDTAYMLEDMEYHNYQREQATRPTTAPKDSPS